MSNPTITLYRLQACPFCERVVRLLEELDLEYKSRFVEPLHSERDVVKRLSGKRTVPAIRDERTGVAMAESDNIVAYLEAIYGDAAADGSEAAEVDREQAEVDREQAEVDREQAESPEPAEAGDA